MASYKVIQDVEAEDKLLGPLTLRQFIYAGISAITLYLCYFSATHSATFMLVILLPFAAVCGFFAFPWGRDQPTEIWALAKIRFMLKPRRRIWDQSGATDLVNITAPKRVHVDYTNGLSETEVRSRLHALADTIDSRGWAIKNANLNMYPGPGLEMAEPMSDRLVTPSSLPRQVSDIDVRADDDILDEKNNARAQAVDNMIEASAKAHREQIMENLRQPVPPQPPTSSPSASKSAQSQPKNEKTAGGNAGTANGANGKYGSNDYWFLNQPARAASIPANMVTFNTQVVTPGMDQAATSAPAAPVQLPAPDADEASLMRALDANRQQQLPTTAYYSHLHTIQPLSAQQQAQQTARLAAGDSSDLPAVGTPPGAAGTQPPLPAPMPMPGQPVDNIAMAQAQAALNPYQPPAEPPVTPATQAAILQLANNNDLNVATLAREADRVNSDEVVIKLH